MFTMPMRDMVAGEACRKSSVSNTKLTLLPNCMRQPDGRVNNLKIYNKSEIYVQT